MEESIDKSKHTDNAADDQQLAAHQAAAVGEERKSDSVPYTGT